MDTLNICLAKSRQSGNRCKNFAVSSRRVCHIHGGKTPKHNKGPKTRLGKMRQRKASLKHGLRSQKRILEAKETRELIRLSKNLINKVA